MTGLNPTPEPDPALGIPPLPPTDQPAAGQPAAGQPAAGQPAAGQPGASTLEPTSGPAAEPDRAPATPESSRSTRRDRADDPLRGSRASGFYAAVAALGVVLILLIIFIAQNTQKTDVNFLGWTGRVSVAVALLIAAAAGLFLALLASSLRILQLRRRVKRERKAH